MAAIAVPSAIANLLAGSQVGALRKKLKPLLKRLEYTVENDLKDFPWNWHQNFKHDAETFKRFNEDLNNLMEDLKTKQFTGSALQVTTAVLFGVMLFVKMVMEIIQLVLLIKDLIDLIKLFKQGFDRVLAYLKELLNLQKLADRVYAELQLALYEALRAALRKAEKIRQLLMLNLRLRIAQVQLEGYKGVKLSLENRLKNNPPTNQVGIINNLIKKAILNIKEQEAEILYCKRAIEALNASG